MSFEAAIRATEIGLAFAMMIAALEHLRGPRADRPIHLARASLAFLLATGVAPLLACLGLLGTSLCLLVRYNGPYNGGADRMGLLVLLCLTIAHMPAPSAWRELAFAYLGAQLVLSYIISGWVKIANPDWRSGRALCEVFETTGYPASDDLRKLANRPRLLRDAGWAVMLLELGFPIALLSQPTLIAALGATAAFHLANALLFGFNRFFWTWIAAYPSIIWLQDRLHWSI